MFKIGEFSRLSRVSVKALRLYDELDLLKPAMVDRFSGYRYYGAEQLPRLNRILVLKELGFSLEQIGQLVREELTTPQLHAMLRLKQAELKQRMEADRLRLELVETRLRYIEQEGTMPQYEVVLKRVEPQLVAALRDTIPNWEQVTPTFNRLFDEAWGYVCQHNGKSAGYAFDRWLDAEMRDTDMNVEVDIPLESPIPESDRVKMVELPGIDSMASVIHHGSFAGLSEAYNALMQWIEANGYRIAGSNRELYIQYDRNGSQDDYVTEIQFPVKKA